jgi:serine/threonine protein kinase
MLRSGAGRLTTSGLVGSDSIAPDSSAVLHSHKHRLQKPQQQAGKQYRIGGLLAAQEPAIPGSVPSFPDNDSAIIVGEASRVLTGDSLPSPEASAKLARHLSDHLTSANFPPVAKRGKNDASESGVVSVQMGSTTNSDSHLALLRAAQARGRGNRRRKKRGGAYSGFFSGCCVGKTTSRTLEELAVLSKLRHPNIAFLMAACVEETHLILLIEVLDGGSVYQILREPTLELSPSQRVRIALDAAQGLAFLHSQDPPILHGDLKTTNLCVTSTFSCKLVDFGLAITSARGRVQDQGTLPWTAPEVLRREVYTSACDVYSFGIVLWELAQPKACTPWASTEASEIGALVVAGRRPLLDSATAMGEDARALIPECWAGNPEDRPTAIEIVSRLEGLLADVERIERRPPPPAAPRPPGLYARRDHARRRRHARALSRGHHDLLRHCRVHAQVVDDDP